MKKIAITRTKIATQDESVFIAAQSGGWAYVGFRNRDEKTVREMASRKELLIRGRKWMRNETGERFGTIDDVSRFLKNISTGIKFSKEDVQKEFNKSYPIF